MKHHIILLHGMGEHEADKWADPYKKTILDTLKTYSAFKDYTEPQFNQLIQFHSLNYDAVMEGFRQDYSQLDALIKIAPGFATGLLKRIKEAADASDGIERAIFYAFLDVALWWGMPEARFDVVARVTSQFQNYLKEINYSDTRDCIHLVAHSLGTSVATDLMIAHAGGINNISPWSGNSFKWSSVFMVANVSRVMEPAFSVHYNEYDTWGRINGIDPFGLCNVYFNLEHTMDPFTWPDRFSNMPMRQGFVPISIKRYDDLSNVHSFSHYFAAPRVSQELVYLLQPNPIPDEEIRQLNKAYKEKYPNDDPNGYQDLRNLLRGEFSDVNPAKLTDFFIEAIEALNTFN